MPIELLTLEEAYRIAGIKEDEHPRFKKFLEHCVQLSKKGKLPPAAFRGLIQSVVEAVRNTKWE